MSNLAGGCRQKHSLPVWSKTQAHILTSQIWLAWVWEDLDLQTGKRTVCCTLTGWEITEAKDSVFDMRAEHSSLKVKIGMHTGLRIPTEYHGRSNCISDGL